MPCNTTTDSQELEREREDHWISAEEEAEFEEAGNESESESGGEGEVSFTDEGLNQTAKPTIPTNFPQRVPCFTPYQHPVQPHMR